MNMKRIKLRLATVVLLGSLMSSCYEDKGNYDYAQMNDITVAIPLESSECVLGDVLKITPELKFLAGKETENLTYLWTFDGQEVGTDRVLNWTIDKDGKFKDLRLAVKDENTGVTYFGSSLLSVISPYTSDGWVTLSAKEDGTSMLTYMRPTTKDDKYTCVVAKDVYGLSNGGAALGGKPIFMSQHFVSRGEPVRTIPVGSGLLRKADKALLTYPVVLIRQKAICLPCSSMAVIRRDSNRSGCMIWSIYQWLSGRTEKSIPV